MKRLFTSESLMPGESHAQLGPGIDRAVASLVKHAERTGKAFAGKPRATVSADLEAGLVLLSVSVPIDL